MPVPAVALSCCCSFSSSSSTLSVNSFRCLPIPRSFTGRRLVWGGSYWCGQQTSLRSSQVLSGSTCIRWRKTLEKSGQKGEGLRGRALGWHQQGHYREQHKAVMCLRPQTALQAGRLIRESR